MSVKQWTENEIMDRCTSESYVRYEEFERVFNALRVLVDAIENDPSSLANEESWIATEDAQQIVDQYE